nr:unnamed protein product [Callosobruchus analis]
MLRKAHLCPTSVAASLQACSSDWSSGLHTCPYFKACPIWR